MPATGRLDARNQAKVVGPIDGLLAVGVNDVRLRTAPGPIDAARPSADRSSTLSTPARAMRGGRWSSRRRCRRRTRSRRARRRRRAASESRHRLHSRATRPMAAPIAASTVPRRRKSHTTSLAAGADGHADADLLRALLHGVGDQAVDANRRQHDRHDAEHRQGPGRQLVDRQRHARLFGKHRSSARSGSSDRAPARDRGRAAWRARGRSPARA